MPVRASRKMTTNPRPTWLSATALDQQLTQICAPGAPPTPAPSPESASGESRPSPPRVPGVPLPGKEFSSAQGERKVGWAARPRCRPLTHRPSPPGAGPAAPHVALPPSGLTLLRLGLRIRFARSRVQQLLQLQRQRLRSRHGHQGLARRRAPERCSPPAKSSLLRDGSPRTVREAPSCAPGSGSPTSGRLPGGGGACVTTGVARTEAHAPGRLTRVRVRLRRGAGGGEGLGRAGARKGTWLPLAQSRDSVKCGSRPLA